MPKTFLIRFLVTVLAVGCVVHTVFFRQTGYFPFQWQHRGVGALIIKPEHGRALPVGLKAGDRFDPREQNLATRAALHAQIRPGETYTFLVHRNGRALKVAVTTTQPLSSGLPAAVVFFGLYLALMLVLGLVTLWWGRDWSAWGLSMFALGIVFNSFLDIPLPSLASFAALLFKYTFSIPLFIVGLYITVFILVGAELTRRVRWLFYISLALVLAAEVAILDTGIILPVLYSTYDTALRTGQIGLILFVISLFLPVLLLFTGYLSMHVVRRVRVRWVLWSLALFVAAIAWQNLSFDLGTGIIGQVVHGVMLLLALVGLIYGLLFKRLVMLSFVINRALVYSLTAIVVVAVFVVLGALVQNFAIGGNAGLALTLGVSLIVGLSLEAVKKRIDRLIERLFFQRKFLAEGTLRRFARQCSFIEHSGRLLDEGATQVHDHIQAPSVALYEQVEGNYVRVRQRGANRFPKRIETDDWAFIALRAEIAETDLSTIQTALGQEGYAFPMAVRGTLQGAFVVAARPEHYTPDERELLGYVAHEVGVALHALRARDNETLIRAIASGTIDPAIARERARQLCSINLHFVTPNGT